MGNLSRIQFEEPAVHVVQYDGDWYAVYRKYSECFGSFAEAWRTAEEYADTNDCEVTPHTGGHA